LKPGARVPSWAAKATAVKRSVNEQSMTSEWILIFMPTLPWKFVKAQECEKNGPASEIPVYGN
jgi:hypothetical protein